MINNGGLITDITKLLEGAGIPYTEESIEPTGLALSPFSPEIRGEAELILKNIEESARKVLEAHLGDTKSSKKFTLGFTTQTAIPNRKNKRKRIQKKWNKRYGLKLKTVVMDGFRMNKTSDGDVCTFESIREI